MHCRYFICARKFYARECTHVKNYATVDINPYSSDGFIVSCVLTERNLFFPLSPQQRGSQSSFFSNKCIFSSIFVVVLVSKKIMKIKNGGCKISEVTR